MIYKLIKIFTNTKVSILLIIIVVILSYWQILFLNIWQDDNALIFKVKNYTEAAGVFGPGATGYGAYRYIALPYIPIEFFLKGNLITYYSLCLVFYSLASLSVYFSGRIFLKSKIAASLSAMLFAAGFIGLEGVTRLFNSIQTSYSITLTCLTFTLLYIFCQKKRIWNYLLAIPLFYLTIETGYVRTQYIILPVVVLFILYAWQKQKITDKLKNIIFLFPFLLIYYYQYFSSPDPRSSSIKELFVNLFSGRFEYLYGLFGSVGNIFFNPYLSDLLFSSAFKILGNPYHQLFFVEASLIFITTIILFKIKKLPSLMICISMFFVSSLWLFLQRIMFQKSEFITIINTENHIKALFTTFIGGKIIIIFLFYILVLKEKGKKILGLFLLSWVVGNALAYSFYLPLNPLETTNRYLTHSLAPLSLLIGLIFLSNVQHKRHLGVVMKKGTLFVILFILLNVLFTNKFLYDFRKNISIPTINFYSQLKSYVPSFNKGAIFYFDIDNDPVARQQFRDFFSVGSMPDSTAIAVRYGVDRYDFFLTENFNELQQKILEEQTNINNIYTFFYKKDVLIYTTNLVRDTIKNRYEQEVVLDQTRSISQPKFETDNIGTNIIMPSLIYSNLSFPSVLPLKLIIEGYITNVDLSLINFPLSDLSKGETVKSFSLNEIISGINIFQQLYNFRNTVKVSDLPSERLTAVDYLIDGDLDTYWRYNRGLWDKNKEVSIMFDLGSEKQVSQIRWVNMFSNSTPTFYSFESSKDNIIWEIIKDVQGKKMDKKEIIEKIKSTNARYFRFIIKETFDHDSPVIAEVSMINSDNDYLTEQDITTINYSPYRYISDFDLLNKIKPILEGNPVIIPISWKTDKSQGVKENVRNIFVNNNEFFREEIIVSEGGTHLKEIQIGPSSVPSILKITRIHLRTLPMVE